MFTISVDDHQAAAELEKAAVSFTLVDPKEYFHHCVGALRAAVNPGIHVFYYDNEDEDEHRMCSKEY